METRGAKHPGTAGPPRPGRGGRGLRARLRAAGCAALLCGPALGGCYALVPVEEGALAPREEVRVWLSAEGEAAVAPVLGGRVRSVEGTVVSVDPSGLSLEVPVAVRQAGFHAERLRQEIRLAPAEVSLLQRRELDRARTAVVVTGTGAALAAAAWLTMTGWTGASTDHPGGGDDPPQLRIPILVLPLP